MSKDFSPNIDRHIVVSYHYIEPLREGGKGIYPCSPEEFERQVSYLSSNYRLGSVADVFEAAQKESTERICALTFDDGLKDQYENAAPILEKFSSPATFFIITDTLYGFISGTHMIHTLLSYIPTETLLLNSERFSKEKRGRGETNRIPRDVRLNPTRSIFDDIPTANFKEVITQLPEQEKKELLNWLFDLHNIDSRYLGETLFMNADNVADLHARGFTIGSHTDRHEALDTIPQDAIRRTLQQSRERIFRITGSAPTVFCYPQGGSSRTVEEELVSTGFTHAVTLEERAVRKSDSALQIPRFDTVRIRAFLNAQDVRQ